MAIGAHLDAIAALDAADGRRWDDRLAAARAHRAVPGLDPDRWRDSVDPYDTGAWGRRLSWGGLVGNCEEPVATAGATPWIGGLEPMRSTDHVAATVREHDADVPFVHALQPVVDRAWAPLQGAGESAALTPPACADLRRALLDRLSAIASPPLGLLFSGQRTLADVALDRIADGTPAGATATEYERFCKVQLDSGFAEPLASFPVLGRLLGTVLLHWAQASRELVARLTTDRPALERAFGIPRDSAITSLTSGLSDPHRGGRGVVAISFDNGGRVVYKPRPVEIEARFQDFVATVSAALPADPLRRLIVLPRRGYGYVEYVTSRIAAEPESLDTFYRNAGRLLAILYLLGATDCHWENMIADRDQLLLIDAETLLEGNPASSVAHPDREAQSLAADSIAGSVLRTGMLPAWISVGPARSVDISALGARGPEDPRALRPSWCFTNTDDMVWGERNVEAFAPGCLPLAPSHPNPLAEHGDALVGGLEEVLTLLMRADVRRRARAGLEAFRGARRRIVVRATRTYVLLQNQALAPRALASSDERAIHLDRLARAYVSSEDPPPTWPLLQHEIAALESLDVPYFEGIVASSDLFVDDEVVVEGYYAKEGLGAALARLDQLSHADCRWQGRLVRGAIAAHRFEMAGDDPRAWPEVRASGHEAGHDADAVARLITSAALEDPAGPPTWLTVALLADATRVQLGLVPPGLYDGRAGIAAFLYDCDQGELADAVLRPVLDALERRDGADVLRYLRTVGLGMAGAGGFLRLFRYVADYDRWSADWEERSSRLIGVLTDELLACDHASDLVSGIAGLAAPVAASHRRAPTPASSRVLATVGRLLVERQLDTGGWSLAPGRPALAGLSHGASGVAAALAEIAVALGDDRYAAAAARGLDFEAGLFDPAASNWPDLRRGLTPANRLMMRSWCHGCVGVGLARLRILELLGTHSHAVRWRDELNVAVESSISAPLGPVDHLCCGNVGRAVVITLAGQATGNDHWESEGVGIGAAVASAAGGDPASYRLLLGIDGAAGLRLPGLMTGLAGIGMYLLHGRDLRWVRYLLL